MFKQNKKLLLFAVYILLLLVPSLFFSMPAALKALYPLLIIVGLVNSYRLFMWLSLPMLLGAPGVIFYYVTFRSPLNEAFWLIVLPSNLFEMRDYLTLNATMPILGGTALFTLWAILYSQLKGTIVSHKWRVGFLCLLIIPLFNLSKLPKHFAESYPWNAVASYIVAEKELYDFPHYALQNLDQLTVEKSGFDQQTLVLVFGESAGRKWHQLFGHTVQNNPELTKNLSNMIVFEDMVTVYPHTIASLPAMLSKKPESNVKPEFLPSFIQVFKKAGYKTFWFSNQSSLGSLRSRIGFYANTTDEQKFFQIDKHDDNKNHDDNVINEFLEKLKDPAPKKLFVLHLQGSHYNFERRYPLEFRKFENSYDNTILYTDYLLGMAIEALKKEHNPAALLYVSDHGLLINDCGHGATHFDNKEAFEVPALLWGSDNWLKTNPSLFKFGRENSKKPALTISIYDTLIDMAGIQYNLYDSKLSLLNEQFSVGKRIVTKYDGKRVDYDHSTNDQRCHIQSQP